MEKGDSSSKEMTTNKTTGFEHVISTPKFKRRKVSVVRDFLPGCGRGAKTNLELNRQITVDQVWPNSGSLEDCAIPRILLVNKSFGAVKLQVERSSLKQSTEELKAVLIKVEAENSVVWVVN
ncbi:hypothetical protein J1N35_043153 [Gossypium stocksii]|uniref:Uncharacterized protein n=1 Tax=Gossypium stocksii TaxID=47602 RepID=A0A9D3ZER0_9ROSI|nr:hypothetical protein J1N35_043153 [Gossypium stocksii]